jgi:hypothetical protein
VFDFSYRTGSEYFHGWISQAKKMNYFGTFVLYHCMKSECMELSLSDKSYISLPNLLVDHDESRGGAERTRVGGTGPIGGTGPNGGAASEQM